MAEQQSRSEDGAEAESRTATVRVWRASRRTPFDELCSGEPETFDVEIHDEIGYVPHDSHVMLESDVDTHKKFAFDVDAPETVELIVEANDSHHQPVEGFEQATPIERGLLFRESKMDNPDLEPFKCEIWGRIRMRVQETDS